MAIVAAPSITIAKTLHGQDRQAVRLLATEVAAQDSAEPLSDEARIRLGAVDAQPGLEHLVARDGERLVGYAQLDRAAEVTAVEAVGQPPALDSLLDAIIARAGEFSLWAHGQNSRLIAVAERHGLSRTRVLWQLRWAVGELPPLNVPEAITLRAFVPGQDEDAWLAVNAAAFAHHPEQGGWTLPDLLGREAERWFDPAGFLLAVDEAVHDLGAPDVVGFHWTKVHTPTLGEVYVIGVHPSAQHRHLGSALLVAGLAHLRERGMKTVLLYVDESNTKAVKLYEGFGFSRYDHDVQYRYAHAGLTV